MIGVDIIELSRMREIMERTGAPFLDRVYTPNERAMAEEGDKLRFLSSAFAAKEAVFKATSHLSLLDRLDFNKIEVGRDEDGRPTVRILPLEEGDNPPDLALHLSISYETNLAIAMVFAPKA